MVAIYSRVVGGPIDGKYLTLGPIVKSYMFSNGHIVDAVGGVPLSQHYVRKTLLTGENIFVPAEWDEDQISEAIAKLPVR